MEEEAIAAAPKFRARPVKCAPPRTEYRILIPDSTVVILIFLKVPELGMGYFGYSWKEFRRNWSVDIEAAHINSAS